MKKVASGLFFVFCIAFVGCQKDIQAQQYKTNIELFWEQLLTFGQLAHDEFRVVAMLKHQLEDLHEPSLAQIKPLSYRQQIEKVVTASEWAFILKQQKLEKTFDSDIKLLAHEACQLQLSPNIVREQALMKKFYQYVRTFCASGNVLKDKRSLGKGSVLEYLQEICIELLRLEQRLNNKSQSPFLFTRLKQWLWGSEFSYEYLPMIIKGGFRGLYFFKLGSSVKEQIGLFRSLTEDIPSQEKDLIASKLWWALYFNTGYTIIDAIISLSCDSYRSMQKKAYMGFQQQEKRRLIAEKIKIDQQYYTRITFDDIVGYDQAKQQVSTIITALENPLKVCMLGGSLPKGILIDGPPGTGKTLFARAVAGEANCPFFVVKASELVGDTAGVLRQYFARAELVGPSILFIDEIDFIAGARNRVGIQDHNQTLAQLLTQLSGFQRVNPYRPILVIAATNAAPDLDEALMRSGRFDLKIHVGLPNKQTRRLLFERYLRLDFEQGLETNVDELVILTDKCSCSDIQTIVNTARLRMINAGDVTLSMDFLRESIGLVRNGMINQI